ncbi:MAG: hypothetical protein II320_04575, partial [Oscillospiraceae bacterium]|nr:hypothetical protein [Oscillospiraceae bacterium]
LAYVPAAEACHADGHAEYWFCPECEAVFADEAGTMLTNRKNLTVVADCELAYVPAAPACHVPGTAEYWYCAECEAVYADEAGTQLTNRKNLAIAPDCELKHVAAVPATKDKAGCAEYWYCEECEAVYADEAGTQLTNRKNLTIPALGEEEIPQTADSSVIILALVALVSVACVVVLNKKKVA